MNPKEWGWEGMARMDRRLGISDYFGGDTNAILCYHSVGDPEEWGSVPTERLRRDLAYLTDRFDVVDLPRVLEQGEGKRVAITFDDGHANFYDHARPVLHEFDVPATVYVVADEVEGKPTNLTSKATMSVQQIDELVGDDLITVGNHTRTHPYLSMIDDPDTRYDEIVGAKERLEERFGVTVDRFCYPSGDFDAAAVELVRKSHDTGVSTYPALVERNSDRAVLPRIQSHWSHSRLRWEVTDLSSAIRNRARDTGLITR